MKKVDFYLDFNVQVWEDPDGIFFYSIIQENEEGGEPIILVYGQGESLEKVLATVKAEVLELI